MNCFLICSSHDISTLYRQFSSLSIDYVILERNYCYFSSGKNPNCRLSNIWKVEDIRLGQSNYTQDKPLICHQLFIQPKPLFKSVFENKQFTVLKLIK